MNIMGYEIASSRIQTSLSEKSRMWQTNRYRLNGKGYVPGKSGCCNITTGSLGGSILLHVLFTFVCCWISIYTTYSILTMID